MISRSEFKLTKNYYYVLILHYLVRSVYWLINIFIRKNKRSNRIVFIEPGNLGDMLMTTAAIRLIKEFTIEKEITCICNSSGVLAIRNNPDIDKIVVIDTPLWYDGTKRKNRRSVYRSFMSFYHAVKKLNADTVINFRHTSYYLDHIAVWLAGIPGRVGFGNKGFDYLLTCAYQYTAKESMPTRKINLIKNWLSLPQDLIYKANPIFFSTQPVKDEANGLLYSIGLHPSDKIIAINPGAQHSFLWPAGHYVKLCNLIHQQNPNTKILFIGTASFAELINNIQSGLLFDTYSLAGFTSLEQLYEVLKHTILLITVDTGTRHLANALNMDVIVLRHGADGISAFGKYVENEEILFHDVPCSPCGKPVCRLATIECMTGIQPFQILKTIDDRKLLPELNYDP